MNSLLKYFFVPNLLIFIEDCADIASVRGGVSMCPNKISTKEKDLKLEAKFSEFLDMCLYRPLESVIHYDENLGVEFTRISDTGLQFEGVDIILKEGAAHTNIDEKSQLHNINKGIPTFALELSYINRSGVVDAGWLLNPHKITDAYLFCWPTAVIDEGNNDDVPRFVGANVLLVHKQQLLQVLEDLGFTRSDLAQRDELLRKNNKDGPYRTNCNDVWFYFSKKYAEEPINLIIRKTLLEKIAVVRLAVQYDAHSQTSQIDGVWCFRDVHARIPVMLPA